MSEGHNKRTFSSINTHVPTESVAQANPAKKPWTTGKCHNQLIELEKNCAPADNKLGPPHGHPMPLQFIKREELVRPLDPKLIVKVKGEWLVQKCGETDYQSCLWLFVTGQWTKFSVTSLHPLSCSDIHDLLPYGYDFDTGNPGFGEDSKMVAEMEADWFEDNKLADKPSVKMSNAMLLEVS